MTKNKLQQLEKFSGKELTEEDYHQIILTAREEISAWQKFRDDAEKRLTQLVDYGK